ncbi:MAG: nucleotide pyrophosphohydrolase [Thermoplasmata archaeon]|nr:nucleotide pyrophosphohydrolase [Thermoplasmata archaeon]
MVDALTTIDALRDRIRRFVHERDWEQFHSPKDLALAISVEAAELLELFLWQPSVSAEDLPRDGRAAAAEELADILIYGFSLANAMEIDVSDAVIAKLTKNETKYPRDAFRGRAR